MIGLSPKALRFVRLVAEAQRVAADEPFLAQLRAQERRGPSGSTISDELGQFCLECIRAFLREPIDAEEWDDNDVLYLESIASLLARGLSHEQTA